MRANIAAGDPRRALDPASLADDQHLGVRRRVAERLHLVAGGGQDRAAAAVDHDRAHRHLAAPRGGLGLGQRARHRRLVQRGHGGTLPARAAAVKPCAEP
jgi:hypothetical protein